MKTCIYENNKYPVTLEMRGEERERDDCEGEDQHRVTDWLMCSPCITIIMSDVFYINVLMSKGSYHYYRVVMTPFSYLKCLCCHATENR